MKFSLTSIIATVFFLSSPSTQAAVYDEFRGIRSAGMGGTHRGIGTSNDSLILNPAGMATLSRYSINIDYAYNNRDELSRAHISAVDSKSSPLAVGIGYTHVRGDTKSVDPSLHYIYAAIAYRISNSIAFGIASKNIRGDFTPEQTKQELDIYNGDLGIQFKISDSLNLGLSYHNLLKTDFIEFTPPTIGAGLSYQYNELIIAADLDADIADSDNAKLSYRAGAEYFYNRVAPIRIGYSHSPFIKNDKSQGQEDIISVGLGYLSQTGSLDMSFSKSIQRVKNWTLIGGIKFFI